MSEEIVCLRSTGLIVLTVPPLLSFDCSYQVRLIIISAIDNRTHCIDLLKHRTGKSLTECRAGKLRFSHGLCRMDNARPSFGRSIPVREPKLNRTLCFQESLCPHFGCDLHHCIITGVCNYLPKVSVPCASAIPHI